MLMLVLFFVVLLPIALFLGFLFTSLSIAALHAMILDSPFSQGWEIAWENPWTTLFWGFIFIGGSSFAANRQ